MKITVIFNIAKILYLKVLRSLLIEAINNPDTDVDDFIMELADKIFEYKEV